MTYGDTDHQARGKVTALVLRIVAERIENGYGAMAASSHQIKIIEEYIARHNIPVYYLLYNPPKMPLEGMTPRPVSSPPTDENELGSRALTSQEAHAALAELLPVGRTPRFGNIRCG